MSRLQKRTEGKRTYEYVPGDAAKTRIYTLGNGMKIYMSENHQTPTVAAAVLVKAGAFDDPLDKTGLAHYLEHMMFKGTSKFGTTDYSKEKPLLDEIERLYDIYNQTTDPKERKRIYSEIDSLSYDAAKYCIPCEYKTIMDSIGVDGANAATSFDSTFFDCTIPANEIRRWAKVESERFLDPVFRGFHTELETVYEVFNEKESSSTIATEQTLKMRDAILYKGIPYCQHSILGKPEHLRNPSISSIRKFFDTYYQPCNMGIILCGDINPADVIEIIDEYFGRLENKMEIPRRAIGDQYHPLTSPVEVQIPSKEHESVLLSWTYPGLYKADKKTRREIELLELGMGILQNSCCGFLDIEKQKHLLNLAECSRNLYPEFSNMSIIATPNDGQTLDQVKGILLEDVRKIGRGEFSDEMIESCKTVRKKSASEILIDNWELATYLFQFFVADMEYESLTDTCEFVDTLGKDELVTTWNKYFNDNYACVISRKGEIAYDKIENPEITPPEFAEDEVSEYHKEILEMESVPIEPRFSDFDKDISKSTLSSGQTLLYVKNDRNDIYHLSFCGEGGFYGNPTISIVSDYLSRVGTQELSMEEVSQMMFKMANTFDLDITRKSNTARFTGIQQNCRKAIGLIEDSFFRPVQDEAELEALKANIVQNRKYSKTSFHSAQSKMLLYGVNGEDVYRTNTSLSDEEMDKLDMATLLDDIKIILGTLDTVTYWGPADEDEVKAILEDSLFVRNFPKKRQPRQTEESFPTTKDDSLVMDFNSPSAFIHVHSNWNEKYCLENNGYVRLLEDYMKDILYKELRESRALSYATTSLFVEPVDLNDNYLFASFAITHFSKVDECMRAIDSIIHDIPVSESVFNKVKDNLLAYARSRRLFGDSLLETYLTKSRIGISYDSAKDTYEQVQRITLDDLMQFYRQKVQNNPFRYLVVGQVDSMDLSFLKSRGEMRVVTSEEVYGW